MKVRYAILHHRGVADPHFDLLYEKAPGSASLIAWRLPHWPVMQNDPVTRLPDHRRMYLDYQGPVSGNRGAVAQVQAGICSVEELGDDHWLIQLQADRRLIIGNQTIAPAED